MTQQMVVNDKNTKKGNEVWQRVSERERWEHWEEGDEKVLLDLSGVYVQPLFN